jgi:hypothetical protein
MFNFIQINRVYRTGHDNEKVEKLTFENVMIKERDIGKRDIMDCKKTC